MPNTRCQMCGLIARVTLEDPVWMCAACAQKWKLSKENDTSSPAGDRALPSIPHLRRIHAVLGLLAQRTPAYSDSSLRCVAEALVLLEDVSVALQVGMMAGLSLAQIQEQHGQLTDELARSAPNAH